MANYPLGYDRVELLSRVSAVERCAEIGVRTGSFAEAMHDAFRPKMMLLVDPWRWMEGSKDPENGPDDVHEGHYREAMRRVGSRPGVVVARATSLEVAPLIAGGSLSFVYLDADHSFSSVSADLRAWWPKVASGGVLAGHDYCPDGAWPWIDVRRAVDSFVSSMGRHLYVTDEPDFPSWAIFR